MSEEKNEKIVYKLYAARTNNEIIRRAESEKFTRVTAEYTLIYSNSDKIIENTLHGIDYTIIEGEDAKRLSAADKDWLMNCNFAIIAEEAIRNKELIIQNMADALTALEEELEKSKAADNGSEDTEEN